MFGAERRGENGTGCERGFFVSTEGGCCGKEDLGPSWLQSGSLTSVCRRGWCVREDASSPAKSDYAFSVLNSSSWHSKNSVNVIKDLAALSIAGLQDSRQFRVTAPILSKKIHLQGYF